MFQTCYLVEQTFTGSTLVEHVIHSQVQLKLEFYRIPEERLCFTHCTSPLILSLTSPYPPITNLCISTRINDLQLSAKLCSVDHEFRHLGVGDQWVGVLGKLLKELGLEQ